RDHRARGGLARGARRGGVELARRARRALAPRPGVHTPGERSCRRPALRGLETSGRTVPLLARSAEGEPAVVGDAREGAELSTLASPERPALAAEHELVTGIREHRPRD